MMVSLGSIEKDSIATPQDSFKICILACEIRNQMHTNFEKRIVSQAVSVVVLLKNGCSVRSMFFTIFVPLSVVKVLEKHCTKYHISQVLEYHGKLKKTK